MPAATLFFLDMPSPSLTPNISSSPSMHLNAFSPIPKIHLISSLPEMPCSDSPANWVDTVGDNCSTYVTSRRQGRESPRISKNHATFRGGLLVPGHEELLRREGQPWEWLDLIVLSAHGKDYISFPLCFVYFGRSQIIVLVWDAWMLETGNICDLRS